MNSVDITDKITVYGVMAFSLMIMMRFAQVLSSWFAAFCVNYQHLECDNHIDCVIFYCIYLGLILVYLCFKFKGDPSHL